MQLQICHRGCKLQLSIGSIPTRFRAACKEGRGNGQGCFGAVNMRFIATKLREVFTTIDTSSLQLLIVLKKIETAISSFNSGSIDMSESFMASVGIKCMIPLFSPHPKEFGPPIYLGLSDFCKWKSAVQYKYCRIVPYLWLQFNSQKICLISYHNVYFVTRQSFIPLSQH